jgi:carbonic anhydrase
MAKLSDDDVHALIRERSGIDSRSVEFRTIADQRATLEHDVQRVRSSPYLPAHLPVGGAVYDVRSGRLEVVVEP